MEQLSVWQDDHRAETGESTEPVLGDVDTVVVGAGLTGLCAALLLARAGQQVAVIEARHLGAGTTARSTAKVSLLQGTHLSQIRGKHPQRVVDDYVRANREGQAWLAEFCSTHDVAVQHRTAYTFAHGPAGAERARAELDAAASAGLPVTWQDDLDLPFATSGAVRLDDQLQLDPFELLLALAAEARRHGAQIIEGARVRGVSGRGPSVVTTERGSLRADRVVLATNLPMLDRGGFFARMSPARSYGLAFDVPAAPVDGMYLSADEPSRSLRDAPGPAGGVRLLVGGNGHPTGRERSASARLDELRSWTAEHFADAVETHAWSAQDFVPHHALPVVGPLLPGAEHLLVAGGYSKWGLTNAPAAALALSARILGGQIEWASAMSSWHGRELRGAAQFLKANGEVGLRMATGWMRPLAPSGATDVPRPGYRRLGPPVAQAAGEESLRAVCTHLGGIVHYNDAERSWDCPLHGSRFDASGEVLEGPAVCGLRRLASHRS